MKTQGKGSVLAAPVGTPGTPAPPCLRGWRPVLALHRVNVIGQQGETERRREARREKRNIREGDGRRKEAKDPVVQLTEQRHVEQDVRQPEVHA